MNYLPLILLLSPAILFAGIDTSYIKNVAFKNDVRLTYGFNSQYIDLYTTAVNPLGDHIYYAPNVKSNARIALNYRFLSFSYGTQVANKLMSPGIFGTTEYNDLAFSWFPRRFGTEIYYRKYSGLYIPAKDYRSAVIRPDLALASAGVNFYFIGNGKKFSYKAASSQTMVQAKSAGAFILLLSGSYRTFAGNYSLLPPALDSSYYFGPIKGIMAMRYFISTLSPGYARNMVAKGGKWYLCPMITSGLGAAKYDFVTETGEDYLYGLHWDVHFRLYGGCSLERFFYGFYFDSESNNNFLSQKIVLNNTSVSFLLTAGCRFGKKKKN